MGAMGARALYDQLAKRKLGEIKFPGVLRFIAGARGSATMRSYLWEGCQFSAQRYFVRQRTLCTALAAMGPSRGCSDEWG